MKRVALLKNPHLFTKRAHEKKATLLSNWLAHKSKFSIDAFLDRSLGN